MTGPRLSIAVFPLLLSTAAAQPQQLVHESLTDWVHVHGAPYWTSNVPEPTSYFGKVEQLNCAGLSWLSFDRPSQFALDPGSYEAVFTIKKRGTAALVDLHSFIYFDNVYVTGATLTTAEQLLNQWVSFKTTFTVTKPSTSVRIRLAETTQTKCDYHFDSFLLWKTSGPEVAFVGNCSDPRWSFQGRSTWSITANRQAVAGRVLAVGAGGTTAIDVSSPPIGLVAGEGYRAYLRFRKVNSANGTQDLRLQFVSYPPPPSRPSITIPAAAQPVNRWVWSPPLRYTPSHNFGATFKIDAPAGLSDYEFAEFVVFRDASYDSFGIPCAGSSANLTAAPPRLGTRFTAQLAGLPSPSAGVLLLGFSDQCYAGLPLPLDLGLINMPGCSLFVSADASIPFAGTSGTAQAGFDVPRSRILLGRVFYNQALFVSQGANPAGLEMTDAGRGIIGL